MDRVFIVNVSSELITWSWEAQSTFNLSSGHVYGTTWSHPNDVEVLPDGRIMVSARNQDRVLFIDPATGVDYEWTLGAEDEYDILHEQHNPDYIPSADGGPAVIVADSENDRIVEYQRTNGEWKRSWTYRDPQLQWPRDADRLPNGHTLITDSNGDRVFEIDEHGNIVWSIPVALPYEAERLSTPAESGNGPSAISIRLESVGEDSSSDPSGGKGGRSLLARGIDTLVPDVIGNTIRFISPVWMGTREYLALAGILIVLVSWPLVELHRAPFDIELRWPVKFNR